MRKLIIAVCFVCALRFAECASKQPEPFKNKVVSYFDQEKQHLGDFEKEIQDIELAFMQGHGNTGQKTMEECPSMCTLELQPVCGSDGQTYSNKCNLAYEACRQKKRIFVEKEGACPDHF